MNYPTYLSCMEHIDQKLKTELVAYVLKRTPVWLFNIAVQEFSTQKLYVRCKQDLMSDYSDLMTGQLDYAIVMAEAFREYECDSTRCKNLRTAIGNQKYAVKLWKGRNSQQYFAAVDAHNTLIEQYAPLIEPQNKLIALYKKLVKK